MSAGKNLKGFTLIEVIMAILVISIVSVLAGMGLVQIANGYVFAKKNASISQQAQITLTRLSKEFSALQSISSASATSITYSHSGQSHTFNWAGADQPLTLDNDILIDKVHNFSLTYYKTYNGTALSDYTSVPSETVIIQIILEMKGYSDTTLTFMDRISI